MKKNRLLFALVGLIFITACNFTEEIYINEDGSGKLSINFDGSEIMETAGEELKKSNDKPVDTLVVFKDLFTEMKDSIATLTPNEQEKLKRLEPYTMHVVMNSAEKVFKFDLYSDFDNISGVNDAFNLFQDASSIGPQLGGDKTNAKSLPKSEPSTKVDYSFEKNKFTRKTTIIDQTLFEKGVDSLASAELFLANSKYTFKYHFPRKIKHVNVEGATFSIDGKTMIYEVGFITMMKNPEALLIEVELEE